MYVDIVVRACVDVNKRLSICNTVRLMFTCSWAIRLKVIAQLMHLSHRK